MKRMRRILLPVVASLCFAGAMAAQDVDLKALDKVGANAVSTTNLTLNSAVLKLGAAFLGADSDSDAAALKSLIGKLKAVYVRVYKFDKPGEYSDADLASIRSLFSSPKWTPVVDVRERKESNQIYFMLSATSDKLNGVAVFTVEPKTVTFVYIDGQLDPSDIAKLSGTMGIPAIPDLDGIKGSDNKGRK